MPVDGNISYAELAAVTGIDEVKLRRFLHFAMINRLFAETPEGRIKHSAASRILKVEPEAIDAVGFLLDDLFVSSSSLK